MFIGILVFREVHLDTVFTGYHLFATESGLTRENILWVRLY